MLHLVAAKGGCRALLSHYFPGPVLAAVGHDTALVGRFEEGVGRLLDARLGLLGVS